MVHQGTSRGAAASGDTNGISNAHDIFTLLVFCLLGPGHTRWRTCILLWKNVGWYNDERKGKCIIKRNNILNYLGSIMA